MVFSAVSGATGPVSAANQPPSQAVQVAQVTQSQAEDSRFVTQYVANYFSDIPVMDNIAWCESRDRQYDSAGDVFRGAVNNQDVGVMQINEHYHLDEATAENYNLYSLEGNTAFARKLYEKFGTAPWNSSKPCWGNMPIPTSDNAGQVAANIK